MVCVCVWYMGYSMCACATTHRPQHHRTSPTIALQYSTHYHTSHISPPLVPARLLSYRYMTVREVSCPISEGIVPINNHKQPMLQTS